MSCEEVSRFVLAHNTTEIEDSARAVFVGVRGLLIGVSQFTNLRYGNWTLSVPFHMLCDLLKIKLLQQKR